MKTAVEFLMDKYRSQNGIITAGDYHTAKELERQQIIDAYMQGNYENGMGVCEEEEYYNKKFKK